LVYIVSVLKNQLMNSIRRCYSIYRQQPFQHTTTTTTNMAPSVDIYGSTLIFSQISSQNSVVSMYNAYQLVQLPFRGWKLHGIRGTVTSKCENFKLGAQRLFSNSNFQKLTQDVQTFFFFKFKSWRKPSNCSHPLVLSSVRGTTSATKSRPSPSPCSSSRDTALSDDKSNSGTQGNIIRLH